MGHYENAPDEMTDEELRRASRALRYRLMEALEEDEWSLEISGDSMLIGGSGVHLDVDSPNWFQLYRPISTPDFSDIADMSAVNSSLPVSGFLASYTSVGGDQMWGAFLRVPAPPDGIPTKALGEWLTSMVTGVAVLAEVHDADVPD